MKHQEAIILFVLLIGSLLGIFHRIIVNDISKHLQPEETLVEKETETIEKESETTVNANAPMVALTFDDGPSKEYTPILLEGLRKRKVRATFFVIGKSAEENPEILKQMRADGHLIGSHTYSHVQLTKISVKDAEKEIYTANEAICRACGYYPVFVRPPYGSWNEKLAIETNMQAVLWNIDPYDWKVKNKEVIIKRVLSHVKDGSIILLHDIYESSVSAALELIDLLKEEGYCFATVEELELD